MVSHSSVSIIPLHCGDLTAGRSMFEQGSGDDAITIPVPAWLIHHPDGVALFDTGMPAALTEPGPMLETVELFFDVTLDTEGLVDRRVTAAEIDPNDIDVIILSHLHFDHAGGLHLVPNARVVVQRTEWAAGSDDDLAAANSFVPELYDLGHDRLEVDGEHDVFGDGRVRCIPTPGHTPGHQSLVVRLDDRDVVLCGDCAYFESTLAGGPLPPIGHDEAAQRRSIEHLRDLGRAGAELVPGHDAEVMARLPAVLT